VLGDIEVVQIRSRSGDAEPVELLLRLESTTLDLTSFTEADFAHFFYAMYQDGRRLESILQEIRR
jgi:hypothetical protein